MAESQQTLMASLETRQLCASPTTSSSESLLDGKDSIPFFHRTDSSLPSHGAAHAHKIQRDSHLSMRNTGKCFGGRQLGIMASSGGADGRGGSRLPEDQLREKEKDGRIRRFIWDVLTLRILAYICAQPASFTFILAFLFITVSMPPMAAIIRHKVQLPDLDTMRVGGYCNTILN